jgi:hypothetical protein
MHLSALLISILVYALLKHPIGLLAIGLFDNCSMGSHKPTRQYPVLPSLFAIRYLAALRALRVFPSLISEPINS